MQCNIDYHLRDINVLFLQITSENTTIKQIKTS